MPIFFKIFMIVSHNVNCIPVVFIYENYVIFEETEVYKMELIDLVLDNFAKENFAAGNFAGRKFYRMEISTRGYFAKFCRVHISPRRIFAGRNFRCVEFLTRVMLIYISPINSDSFTQITKNKIEELLNIFDNRDSLRQIQQHRKFY